MEISLRRCHTLMVGDVAFSHEIHYVAILNLEMHLTHITGSRVTAVLLNGLILPIGEASAVEGLVSMGPTPSSFTNKSK